MSTARAERFTWLMARLGARKTPCKVQHKRVRCFLEDEMTCEAH